MGFPLTRSGLFLQNAPDLKGPHQGYLILLLKTGKCNETDCNAKYYWCGTSLLQQKILRLNKGISSMGAAILIDSVPSFRTQTGEEGEQTWQTTVMRALVK